MRFMRDMRPVTPSDDLSPPSKKNLPTATGSSGPCQQAVEQYHALNTYNRRKQRLDEAPTACKGRSKTLIERQPHTNALPSPYRGHRSINSLWTASWSSSNQSLSHLWRSRTTKLAIGEWLRNTQMHRLASVAPRPSANHAFSPEPAMQSSGDTTALSPALCAVPASTTGGTNACSVSTP
ncbi:hypothetical protein EJ03DRAFT_329571 [Teratosphaeria nubilosa]|uniref:Uncharacterized protein n=1 Tax=Teratosphaeria nubilosa TaxID=161662 RepID=A0A6G1L2V0_9PEZI|nr:hypothetical protein EJ03DRAFT_329571 [Teratosphaeria nubilosa]